MDALVSLLKAVGEPTRLRLVNLLARGELTVSEMTQVLGQSQPRVSRHLRLLCEAGALDRFREGSWVFYRLAEPPGAPGRTGRLAGFLTQMLEGEDPQIARDLERLAAVRARRAEEAARYFRENADRWDRIRALHLPEREVEAAMDGLLGPRRAELHVDIGTGTGRMLELFAPRAARGVGVDASHDMLTVARANLARAGHGHCHVRLGDAYALPLESESSDLVTVHQVLHYLDDPAAALKEAARILRPGGRLLVADFAPHELEFLRADHAHRRLGFSDGEVSRWLQAAGLTVGETRHLPEPEGPQRPAELTVTLWLAHRPAGQGRADTRSDSAEEAAA